MKYKTTCPKCGGRLIVEYAFPGYEAVCLNCHIAEYGETLETTLELVNNAAETTADDMERGRA